jgi:antibiotic biosynthesis monooxygenase (ABM) superfamily enzyme
MTMKKSVAVIDPAQPRITVVNVYEVAPERQAELTALLAKATDEVMRRFPGFVSVSIHRSLDGTRVVNYAQWASKEDVGRMMKSPEAQAQIRQFASVAKSVSPALYEVSSVHVP